MISKIIENGCGYVIEGHVYFSVDNFPDYGCLSGRKFDDNRAGGGGQVYIDLRKRNSADFAWWKATLSLRGCNGTPINEMDTTVPPVTRPDKLSDQPRYLIKYGIIDSIRIAQSCAACPESHVSYWMHNGFVNKDNQKMSKSDNNFFTIRYTLIHDCEVALSIFREGEALHPTILIQKQWREKVLDATQALPNRESVLSGK